MPAAVLLKFYSRPGRYADYINIGSHFVPFHKSGTTVIGGHMRIWPISGKLFFILALIIASNLATLGQGAIWSPVTGPSRIRTNNAVRRATFPKEFKLFSLNRGDLDQALSSALDRAGASTVVSLPNADGRLEQYEVYEASNFEPDLQARFPDIRAFSGRGINDKYATVKLSVSPNGVQATIFRAASGFLKEGGQTEIIESYSADHTVYAVFKSHREANSLPWTCSSPVEATLFSQWSNQINAERAAAPESKAGEIRVMRLAQSCNGEYANYFGAHSAADVAKVLAGFNATLTRANGVYERDLGVHMNLISDSTKIIFYDGATDPYSDSGNLSDWNQQLADAIAAAGITPAMYDIGHMFGASGGGGNAGCIGCVCSTDHEKGMGITSPADDIPEGDNFDIDYVVHEVGHQLGANHTFSYGQLPVPEQMGQDKEIGSGITIMGYAGVGVQSNIAIHSIDSYHETSIGQIQANLPIRGCPAAGITMVTGNHAPVVAPVSNYTIPVLTPFALTGSATDADGDALTYNWEEDDSSQDLGASVEYSSANPVKPVGPNFVSFPSSTSGTKMFPQLSTILAGQFVTRPYTGGDPNMLMEALSTIPRDLHFRLTVRDNHPYVPGVAIGQTNFADMTVSVTNLAGPFKVTAPDTGETWVGGTPQTITWLTANTNMAPVSTANVNIRLSIDGGQTFPIMLKSNTPNDGTEVVTIPRIGTSSARILVEAAGNIFFDISDTSFTIIGPTFASVGGRITNDGGRGITGTAVTMTTREGTVRTTTTDRQGRYVFDQVPVGQMYEIRASQNRYQFTPETIMYNHFEQNSSQGFTGAKR